MDFSEATGLEKPHIKMADRVLNARQAMEEDAGLTSVIKVCDLVMGQTSTLALFKVVLFTNGAEYPITGRRALLF